MVNRFGIPGADMGILSHFGQLMLHLIVNRLVRDGPEMFMRHILLNLVHILVHQWLINAPGIVNTARLSTHGAVNVPGIVKVLI